MFAATPLGNDQFAAALFLQGHGVVQGDNGAFRLLVRRGLGGDALQPEAGGGHQGEERSTMFGCESNNFVGSAGNHREQCDPHSEASPESGHWNQRVHQDRNQHNGHQETGAAASKGRNLYVKIKKPREKIMLTAAIQPLTSSFLPLSSAGISSRATLAE